MEDDSLEPMKIATGTFKRWTREEIDAAASEYGGYGKKELAALGVTWPQKRGWQEALMAGLDPNNPPDGIKDAVIVDGADELLRLVVLEVVGWGMAHRLHHIPGLLDRFGAQLKDPES